MAANFNIAERANVMRDGCDQQADAQEGNEKADRCQKESSMWPVRDALVNEQSQVRSVQQEKHHRSG